MGIIKAVLSAVKGGLADQWLEVIESSPMGDTTVFTTGVRVRANDKRDRNRKGTEDIISNGSVIHVYPNQFMMLMDGGRIVDYTAEEGYYEVNSSSAPSLLNGELGKAVEETFNRIRFGGASSLGQKVYFINLQEIKGIKFGTRTPINYFDTFYNAELFLRAHGTYSIKITDPIRFYAEAVPKNRETVDMRDINEQYFSEFLEALQTSINQMSADGVRISFVPSKGRELSRYMASVLDEEWKQMRGMEIQSVGIASISYDEESQKLIHMRNQGAMLGDAAVREGYVQGAVARGMEAAGSNPKGSMAGFMGMGMGMQSSAGFVGAASATNLRQMEMEESRRAAERSARQAQNTRQAEAAQRTQGEAWVCSCGHENKGNFCELCGKPAPKKETESWVCSECGAQNKGNFCSQCGAKKPQKQKIRCKNCGYEPDMEGVLPKFCPQCGDPIGEEDRI